jgi:hypothetical protein
MGTTWILHTETKGTGAQMVPLNKATQRSRDPERVFVRDKAGRARQPESPKLRARREFRIVDVMTRRELASSVPVGEALAVLRGVRSVVDVWVYVWEQDRVRWRQLTFEEQHRLMDLAVRQAA